MQTRPYMQLGPPPALPPGEYAKKIGWATRVRRCPDLAPLVERFAGAGPILRAPPAPGWVPLRPDARKVLAFDGAARRRLLGFTPIAGAMGALAAVFGIVGAIAERDASDLLVSAVGTVVVAVALAAGLFSAAARLRALRRVLARSVVVQATVIARSVMVIPRVKTWGILSVVYVHAGASCQGSVPVDYSDIELVGPTPQLLLDTEKPGELLVRDFYV